MSRKIGIPIRSVCSILYRIIAIQLCLIPCKVFEELRNSRDVIGDLHSKRQGN